MFLFKNEETKQVFKKWEKLVEGTSETASAITSQDMKYVTARLFENQAKERNRVSDAPMRNLNEDTPGNVTAGIGTYDPVLIAMVRRAAPMLIAPDIVGVQPMKQSTGLAFAMTLHYGDQPGASNANEAYVNEPNSAWSGVSSDGSKGDDGSPVASDTEEDPFAALYTAGEAGETADFEGDITASMSMKITSISVHAKTRALRSTFSREMEQDLQAAHGLSADAIISGLMTDEMTAEQNRELIRKLYRVAMPGAQRDVQTAGIFDLNTDSNGRWLVERFKGLMFQLDREANQIYFKTRRGRANFVIASADVVSAFAAAGMLDYDSPVARAQGVTSDVSRGTYAGVLNGQYKVYIDPYITVRNFILVGYRGTDMTDAGIFWCPYVPYIPERAIDPKSGQPIMFFKTRYGLVANPFVRKADGSADGEDMTKDRNQYYSKFRVDNLT